MRSLTSVVMAFLVLIVCCAAIPITPAAPGLEKRAEKFRLERISEHEIAERLTAPDPQVDAGPQPLYTRFTRKVRDTFFHPFESDKRDPSGDIAPGSLESPSMLPRAPAPESFAEGIAEKIKSILRGRKAENFGYEGKELEMRRPQGMRHWIA